MRIRNLTYELKRPVALALASVAVVAVLIAVVLAWQQAEESHDLRRRARLLMMSEATARNELEQMRQTAGALAALTARTTAQQQELSRLESARGQAQGQLAEAQQDLVAQQAARSELAKMIEADVRRAGEMRAQQEQVSAGLNTLREENAGLERRVAESKRELEATQGQLAEVQQELLAQQTARSALANMMEADARRAGEMRVQQQQVTAGLNTLREESAGLERRLAESKRELDDTQGQLAKVHQDLVAQQAARSEFAKMMEADSRRAGEMRAQQEQVSTGLSTLREESAGFERRVAELKRELEDTQRQLDNARVEDAQAQQQRERAASASVGASAEQRGSAQTSGAISPTSLRASKLTGVPVIGLDHVSVGEIDDVLIGREQEGVVVVRTGGILGLGGKLVALPFEQFLWNTGDLSRPSPGASVAPRNAPGSGATPAERMPGAQISTEALRATEEPGGRISADTGPVTTGAAEQATALVVGRSGGPVQAMVRLTKAELEQAPAFRYAVRNAE